MGLYYLKIIRILNESKKKPEPREGSGQPDCMKKH
jgi:hypothetical protein